METQSSEQVHVVVRRGETDNKRRYKRETQHHQRNSQGLRKRCETDLYKKKSRQAFFLVPDFENLSETFQEFAERMLMLLITAAIRATENALINLSDFLEGTTNTSSLEFKRKRGNEDNMEDFRYAEFYARIPCRELQSPPEGLQI